ncbi:MAG: acyl-CoA dehydrogenase family protein, partial [Steroidobacteraceae bacterium]
MEAKQVAEARAGAGATTTEDLPSRAKIVAAVAANHAVAVDSAARFPAESFQAVKAQRLLGIQVPRALGGEGVSIGDVADVCYQLGQSCGSTGMIFAMHQIKVACIMRHMGENA